ncbi:MAG: CHAT domain-containing protein [Parafilimonas sp.]
MCPVFLLRAGISVTTVSDTVATEEKFKALEGRSPEVFHIATHGFFWSTKEKSFNNNFTLQQDSMFRSGLVLAGCNNTQADKEYIPGNHEDGILTAYEIAQMDLSNTNLAVLSACETALGDLQGNEGVIGLQRAFKMAGVKQMIISLWRVSDKQTVELMRMFYKNWLNGESTRDALRSAQLKMKEKYPPYDWAAFVFVE